MSIVLHHFGVAARGNATLEIACIGYSVLGNTKVRYDTGFSIETFCVKQMSPLLPPFTPFGSAVRGKGIPNISHIGHSVLENTKVRHDNGLTLRDLHKYMSILSPPLALRSGVKPHLRCWYWSVRTRGGPMYAMSVILTLVLLHK